MNILDLNMDDLTDAELMIWQRTFDMVAAQTHNEQRANLAAWGAVIKARKHGEFRMAALRRANGVLSVEGWGMLFTGPDDPDALDTHFSTMTATLAEYYKGAPLWYEHGLDPDFRWQPIGRRTALDVYGFGIFVTHELHTDHDMIDRTVAELEAGKLAYSSDSIAHYVESGFNFMSGHNRVWPLAGWSLTAAPAEAALGPVTMSELQTATEALTAAGQKRYNIGEQVVVVTAARSQFIVGDSRQAGDAPANVDLNQSDDNADNSVASFLAGRSHMDPEVLAQLAEFLGVEATAEAVRIALEDLIASLQSTGAEGEPEPMRSEDVDALASALDLDPEQATGADVAHVLTDVVALLQTQDSPDGEPAQVRSLNVGALRSAHDALNDDPAALVPFVVQTFEPGQVPAARSTTPHRQAAQPSTEPGYVGTDDPELSASHVDNMTAMSTGHAARRVQPRRSIDHPHFHRGTAPPGLIDAIYVAMGLRAPSMPNTPNHIARRHVANMERESAAFRANVSSDDGPRGGFVLARDISNTVLDPLLATEVVLAAGAQVYPMDGIDSLDIPKSTQIPGAYWADEWQTTIGDQPEWGIATLRLKALRCPVRLPNKWLKHLVPGAEAQVNKQIVQAMRLKMDYAFLRGDGSVPNDGVSQGQQPVGIRYTENVTTTSLAGAAPGIGDLKTAVAVLEDADVPETDQWAWISHPRTFRTFEYMTDDAGVPIIRNSWSEGPSGMLVAHPYYKTSQVPKNLGGGSDQSEMYFGDWGLCAVGMGMDVDVLVSEHLYMNYDQLFLMAVAYVDFVVLYPEAFHVHTAVGA